MREISAPPKNTGGGGFTFADKVATWVLAHAIAGRALPLPQLRSVVRLDFEVSGAGWNLDDLLLTCRGESATYRVAISIKSYVQITGARFPSDFVDRVAKQWMPSDSNPFDRDSDYLALIAAPSSSKNERAIAELLKLARVGDVETLRRRNGNAGAVSQDVRSFFKSFVCDASDIDDRVMLLQRVIYKSFDFEAEASKADSETLELCRLALRDTDETSARALVNELRSLAADLRGLGGGISVDELVARLSPRFDLQEFPDFRSDWEQIDEYARSCAQAISRLVAGRLKLDRSSFAQTVSETLHQHQFVFLVGASGCGKSAVAAQVAERQLAAERHVVWVDARRLQNSTPDSLEGLPSLRFSLVELLSRSTTSDGLIVIDGLDSEFSETPFDAIAILLRAATAAGWHVLLTAQDGQLDRVRMKCAEKLGATLQSNTLRVGDLTSGELTDLRQSFPHALPLFEAVETNPTRASLKLLAEVLTRHTHIAADVATLSEAGFADLAWKKIVEHSGSQLSRARAICDLATLLGDRVAGKMPSTELPGDALSELDTLVRERICVAEQHSVRFEHDLYGDWARLQVLVRSEPNVALFLAESVYGTPRACTPLWQRALGLYGVHLLDRDSGIGDWLELLSKLVERAGLAAGDGLLASMLRRTDADAILEAAREALFTEKGTVLGRLLVYVMLEATRPIPNAATLGKVSGLEPDESQQTLREPIRRLWEPVVRFLHRHRVLVSELQPVLVSRVVHKWLVPVNWSAPARREAAELALLLAEQSRRKWLQHQWGDERGHRARCYQAILMAAFDLPEEVITFARRAAELEPLSAEETHLVDHRSPRRRDSIDAPIKPYTFSPIREVDAAFREAVLYSLYAVPFFNANPSVARDVVLACCVNAGNERSLKHEYNRESMWNIREDLQHHEPRPTEGPFLNLLRASFDDGLRAVLDLVDGACKRILVRGPLQVTHSGFLDIDDDDRVDDDFVDPRARGSKNASHGQNGLSSLPTICLKSGDGEKSFIGDGSVFGWLWYAGSPTPSVLLTSALMALEYSLYERLAAKQDIAQLVQRVLADTECLPILPVLLNAGKLIPELFETVLFPLLTSVEIQALDICAVTGQRTRLRISVSHDMEPSATQSYYLATHRTVDLRHVLTRIVLYSDGARFDAVRTEWKRQLDNPPAGVDREFIHQLLGLLEKTAYHATAQPDGTIVVENHHAEQAYAHKRDQLLKDNKRVRYLGLPIHGWAVFTGRAVIADADIDELREFVEAPIETRICAGQFGLSLSGFDDRDCIAAAAALLVKHAEDQSVSGNAHFEAVRGAMLRVLEASPVFGPERHDNRNAPSDWDWFVAYVTVVLWSKAPNDCEIRRAVARLAFAPHVSAIANLFDTTTKHRDLLGDDLPRLRNLAVEAARIIHLAKFCQHEPSWNTTYTVEDLKKWRDALEFEAIRVISEFVEGKTSAANVGWPAPTSDQVDSVRQALGWEGGIDEVELERFVMINRWMLRWSLLKSSEDRGLARDFLVGAVMQLSQWVRDSEGGGIPWPFEYELLDGFARAVIACEDSALENTWKALLLARATPPDTSGAPRAMVRHIDDHYRRVLFLQCLNRVGLAEYGTDTRFRIVRQKVIDFILNAQDVEWSSHDEGWRALVGFDHGVESYGWDASHASLVGDTLKMIPDWLCRAGGYQDNLSTLCRWLMKPCCKPIRVRALPHLARAVLSLGYASRPEELDRAVSTLLRRAWIDSRGELARAPHAAEAFWALLNKLSERGDEGAIRLAADIGAGGV